MKRIALILAAAVTLAGCGGEAKDASTARTPAPAATTAPAAKTAPEANALGAAQTIDSPQAAIKATAYKYRQPLPSAFPPDRKGYTYAGVDARVCLTRLTGADVMPVSWMPWSLEFADDTTIEPASSWSEEDFRVPLYPGSEKLLRPGACLRGWILFEIPKTRRPVRVVYAPDSGTDAGLRPAMWALR